MVEVEKAVCQATARECPLRSRETLAGEFPGEARSTKQCGRMLRLLPVALFSGFTCSFDKTSRSISAITGLKTSAGWCWAQCGKAGHRRETEEFKEDAGNRLRDEKAVSADGTGFRCGRKNAWSHTASTPGLALRHASMKSGVEGMKEGGFPGSYGRILVHGCLGSYWTMSKPEKRALTGDGAPSAAPAGGGDGGAEPYAHALCRQHLSRELVRACGHGHGQEEGRRNRALELCRFLRPLGSLRKESMARGGK